MLARSKGEAAARFSKILACTCTFSLSPISFPSKHYQTNRGCSATEEDDQMERRVQVYGPCVVWQLERREREGRAHTHACMQYKTWPAHIFPHGTSD
jgi:hypothetical protein